MDAVLWWTGLVVWAVAAATGLLAFVACSIEWYLRRFRVLGAVVAFCIDRAKKRVGHIPG